MSSAKRASGLKRAVDSVKCSTRSDKKTPFDYFTAASSFSSAILVAIIGAFVTLIQQRSIAANQKLEQMRIDAAKTAELAHQTKQDTVTETAGIQNRRILAVQTVGQFMPYLTSKDEVRQKWAITAISALSTSTDPNDTLAISLAKLNPTAGSKAALESIAANAISEEAKRNARSALNGFQASNITSMSKMVSTSTNELGSAIREAEALHEQAQDENAALNFDKTHLFQSSNLASTTITAMHPSNLKTNPKELLASLQAYIAILAGFADDLPNAQLKAKITNFGNVQIGPPKDQDYSESSNLKHLSEALVSEKQIIDAIMGNRIGIAQFVQESDSYIALLCQVLQNDILILREQRIEDAHTLLNSGTLFLQSPDGHRLEPDKRQEAVRKLAELQRKSKTGNVGLDETELSIAEIQSMHHALAADLQGNNPHGKIAQFVSSTRKLK